MKLARLCSGCLVLALCTVAVSAFGSEEDDVERLVRVSLDRKKAEPLRTTKGRRITATLDGKAVAYLSNVFAKRRIRRNLDDSNYLTLIDERGEEPPAAIAASVPAAKPEPKKPAAAKPEPKKPATAKAAPAKPTTAPLEPASSGDKSAPGRLIRQGLTGDNAVSRPAAVKPRVIRISLD
jgi:cell division septation protein DedD